MSKEILVIPEDKLLETIKVLRAGLKATENDKTISNETREQLTKWCDEENVYISMMRENND